MLTNTRTTTYTIADIKRVLSSFAADFAMIAQATGLRSRDNVAMIVGDLAGFASANYLEAIDIILWKANGTKLRAAKFTVSGTAAGWTNDRPGNNLWPRTTDGSLQVVATLKSAWWELSDAEKGHARVKWDIKATWAHTDTDTSHSDLTAADDRQYASNGYGLQKMQYC